jgi:hypothetical protein
MSDYLQEVRGTLEAIDWRECDPTGYDVAIMANQYLGLLQQRRYQEADAQLGEMSGRAFSGSHKQRLEWLIAARSGFWVLLEQRDWERIEGRIELVRGFRRIHPGDDYEAPHALVAMLLPAFEAAEGCGYTALADRYFEEACSLGGVAQDHYGHIKRIHDELSKGNLGGIGRSDLRALRLAQVWALLV